MLNEIQAWIARRRQKNKERMATAAEGQQMSLLQNTVAKKSRDKLEQELHLQKGILAMKYLLLKTKFERGQELAEMLKQKIDQIENVKFHQFSQLADQRQEINDLRMELRNSKEQMEKDVSKLLVYKVQAEEKKPLEIQACMKAYVNMAFKTNMLVRQLQIAHKHSGLPISAGERMQIVASDRNQLVLRGFDDLFKDQDRASLVE